MDLKQIKDLILSNLFHKEKEQEGKFHGYWRMGSSDLQSIAEAFYKHLSLIQGEAAKAMRIAELEAELESLRSKQEWIPIEAGLPADYGYYGIKVVGRRYPQVAHYTHLPENIREHWHEINEPQHPIQHVTHYEYIEGVSPRPATPPQTPPNGK